MRNALTAARWRALVGESLRSIARHPLASGSLALIACVTTGAVLVTSGNAFATEEAVIRSLDDTGSRVVVLYDPDGGAAIDGATVDMIGRTDAAVWTLGLGAAVDHQVDEDAGRAPVAVRPVSGDLEQALELVSGRAPRPGEALIGERAAQASGLVDGVGGLSSGTADVAVVGVFRAAGPLDQLNDLALVLSDLDKDAGSIRYVYSMAPTIAQVSVLAQAMKAAAIAVDASRVRVDEPSAAVDLQRIIGGELGAASRRSMTLILATSGALVLTVVTMVVGARRRDVGRWRALGASRSAVVVGFLVQVGVPVASGAAVGAVGAQVWNAMSRDFTNSWSFAGALVVDAVLVGLLAAVPPAVAAARRDPVRVLRVP